jgi:dihydroorotate dehydrogenase
LTYSLIFKLALSRLDPERAHILASRLLSTRAASGTLRALAGRTVGAPDPCLGVKAFGLEFPSPLGVAAGLDKEATWFDGLCALGFGFVEVGTVTALAQPGNPRPRIFRLPADRALINRMGFPNPGAAAVAARLGARDRSRRRLIGANVGKSKLTPLEQAAEDYGRSVRALAPACDYLVINVSSPNTPGLRDLQKADSLREIVGAVRHELTRIGVRLPLLVKLAPDLDDAQLDELAGLALELELDGIVAVNTTLDRGGLTGSGERARSIEGGGVSGAPLKPRALEVLRRLRERVGSELVLISVGGIESPEDAWERIRSGATLVQAYTAFVYNGPAWPARMNRELARLVHEAGYDSVQQAIGEAPAVAGGG